MVLRPPEIQYDGIRTKIGGKPIIPDKLHQSYQLQIESLPTSLQKIFDGNSLQSKTGVILKLRRKSLGHLESSFYYPTASFALLSMISYFIKPDIVSCFIRLDDYIQLWSHANRRFPVYEAKVLFSQGCGRM